MPRTGRPKTDSPKLRSLSLRVDDEEYEKLKDYAAKHDMTITQVLHRGVEIQYSMEESK